MGIHSKFLVHWTGKDLPSGESDQYLERLRNCCEFGLYMKKGVEAIQGSNSTTATAVVSRVCFSEIRLSQVQKHAKLYGAMGIGFNREFVIERMGGPVFYVQNGSNGVVIEHFAHIHKYLRENKKQEMIKRMNTIMGYLKNMSDPADNNLHYYEEMEWRVIQIECLEGKYIIPENPSAGIYRLIFKPEDVELIVFPDKETKQLALIDKFILDFFKNHLPIIATVNDCDNF
jgi:hypothetical protein